MSPREIELAQVLWDFHRIDDSLEKADLIVGLGSYDLRVAEHAAKLLRDGWANWLAFTGAEGNFTRGKWPKSEAEMFADVARGAGAPADQILVETRATNTGENALLTKAMCEARGIAVGSVILVAKPNMTRRGLATWQLRWPEVRVICSSPDTHFLTSPAEGHSPEEVVNEIVGDLQRMIEYPKLGYQAEQEIPDNVLSAFEELVSLGFSSHLIK
ncbi:MAG: uncharacterized SAM-binding protein YcdF (DUF218 family) [Verrucomicrobiales bacterium]